MRRIEALEDRLPQQVVGEAVPVAGGRQHPGHDGVTGGDFDGERRGVQGAGDDIRQKAGAGDRSHLEQCLGGAGEPGDPPFDGVADGGGDMVDAAAGVVGEQGDFAHEEWVAASSSVNGVGGRTIDGSSHPSLDQLVGGIGINALDVNVVGVADQRSEPRPGRGVQLVVAVGADEADP